MKFGICYCYWSKDWEGTDYPQTIARARKCGFDVLEIFYGRLLDMAQTEVDEIKAACKEYDVELYCCGGFDKEHDLTQKDPAARAHAIEKAKEIIKAASRVGSRNFSGINYSQWCNFDNPLDKEERLSLAVPSLQEVGKFAGDYGLSWNMEVVNRFENYLLNTAKEAVDLCKEVNNPNINILLDIFHGMIEEDDLAEAIKTAGDHLGHYHMGSNNRRPPRPGFLPWKDVCQALKDINYDRCVSFEPLVRTGGTVALGGGNVWREMLPQGADDKMLDDILIESLNFIKGMF